jgi:large subunit ribosomal protein L31
MKKSIHPKYNSEATVTCSSCGLVRHMGSTEADLKVELCSNCHPFYTGKDIIVDRDDLVGKFNERKAKAAEMSATLVKKKEKKQIAKKEASSGMSLKDMLMNIK